MKSFFTKKKIIWTVIILMALGGAGYKIIKGKNPAAGIQTDTVKKQNLKQTVLATGQVVSETDLSLSFNVGGNVAKVSAKEGDKVKSGTVLAELDQKNQYAALTTARGALANAQAAYNKVLAGASSEEVAVYQVALDNAKSALENTKRQQQVLVDSAYKALLNSGLAAVPSSGNVGSVNAIVTGTYTGTDQGVYKVVVYTTGSGLRFQFSGLETGDGQVDVTPQPLGLRGLFIQFSVTSVPVNNVWTVSVPNPQASAYVTNYNAYQSALESQKTAIAAAENAITAAQANLDLKRAQARPADLEAAQAQILSAQGQVLAAQAALENTVVRAPANGTVTSVDIKPGELATAMKEVFILQDVGNLHVEANVSEANIADIRPGQEVDITFDALGPDRHFSAKVQTVNPASTLVSGVVNYKVTASLGDVAEIKPGMTANMTVLTGQQDGVLSVPLQAVLNRDGGQYIKVIDDAKKKTYHEVQIRTGMQADGGLVEVTGGLAEGQEIVTYIKQ